MVNGVELVLACLPLASDTFTATKPAVAKDPSAAGVWGEADAISALPRPPGKFSMASAEATVVSVIGLLFVGGAKVVTEAVTVPLSAAPVLSLKPLLPIWTCRLWRHWSSTVRQVR